jgi:hypothetical protein
MSGPRTAHSRVGRYRPTSTCVFLKVVFDKSVRGAYLSAPASDGAHAARWSLKTESYSRDRYRGSLSRHF